MEADTILSCFQLKQSTNLCDLCDATDFNEADELVRFSFLGAISTGVGEVARGRVIIFTFTGRRREDDEVPAKIGAGNDLLDGIRGGGDLELREQQYNIRILTYH